MVNLFGRCTLFSETIPPSHMRQSLPTTSRGVPRGEPARQRREPSYFEVSWHGGLEGRHYLFLGLCDWIRYSVRPAVGFLWWVSDTADRFVE